MNIEIILPMRPMGRSDHHKIKSHSLIKYIIDVANIICQVGLIGHTFKFCLIYTVLIM